MKVTKPVHRSLLFWGTRVTPGPAVRFLHASGHYCFILLGTESISEALITLSTLGVAHYYTMEEMGWLGEQRGQKKNCTEENMISNMIFVCGIFTLKGLSRLPQETGFLTWTTVWPFVQNFHSTVQQLHISHSSFLSLHLSSFLSTSSFSYPWDFRGYLDRGVDFRSVYGQDLRKSTSDKQIPWIHKTSRSTFREALLEGHDQKNITKKRIWTEGPGITKMCPCFLVFLFWQKRLNL